MNEAMMYGFFDEMYGIDKEAGFFRKAGMTAAMLAALAGGGKAMGKRVAAAGTKSLRPAITQTVKKAPATNLRVGGAGEQMRTLGKWMP